MSDMTKPKLPLSQGIDPTCVDFDDENEHMGEYKYVIVDANGHVLSPEELAWLNLAAKHYTPTAAAPVREEK